MCYLVIEAGYFIGIDKSQSTPLTSVCFFGFVCDSLVRDFLIPEDKRMKFSALREGILSSPLVSLKTFQGKVISCYSCLVIPSLKLYEREVFKAISRHLGYSRPTVKIEASFQAEIASWRFLDD